MEINFEIIFWTLYGVWVLIAIILFGVSFAKKDKITKEQDKTLAGISYFMFVIAILPILFKTPLLSVVAYMFMTNN